MSRPVPRMNRRAFRRAVRLRCQIVRERDFRLVGDFAYDLSTEGMLASLGPKVLTGEPVIVSFRSLRLGRWFDAEATVARVLHGRRDGDEGRSLGLAFGDADPDFREDLFQHLRRLPPPAPRRPLARAIAPELALPPLFGSANGRLTVS